MFHERKKKMKKEIYIYTIISVTQCFCFEDILFLRNDVALWEFSQVIVEITSCSDVHYGSIVNEKQQ